MKSSQYADKFVNKIYSKSNIVLIYWAFIWDIIYVAALNR